MRETDGEDRAIRTLYRVKQTEALERKLHEQSVGFAAMVTEPELLIVRLGLQTARNELVPDIVREALSLRASNRDFRTTWIVQEPTQPFRAPKNRTDRVMVAWSPGLQDHLDAEYPIVALKDEPKGEFTDLAGV